jgi:hypothetical protein
MRSKENYLTSYKNRFLMIAALLSALTALPMAAHGAIATGSISGEDVIGGGDWKTGVSVGWILADAGSAYLYSDTFEAPSPGLSPFDLQVRGGFSERNIFVTPGRDDIPVPDTTFPRLSEPGTMFLLGSALLGIAVWRRRRMRMQD